MSYGMRKIAAGVIAGAAIAAFAVPGSANASGLSVKHSASPSTSGRVSVSSQMTRQTATKDQFLAGWYSFVNGGLASSSATFRVPTGACPDTMDIQDLGFGVYGIPTGAVDLNNTSQADVQIDCEGAGPLYYISAYTNGGGNNYVPTNPGDLVVTSLYENGTTTVATVHDLTSHVTVTSTGSSVFDTGSNIGSYNYFYTSPGYIPSFTKTKFNEAQVNGDYLKYSNPTQLNMASIRPVQIAAGALSANGDSFSETFRHT